MNLRQIFLVIPLIVVGLLIGEGCHTSSRPSDETRSAVSVPKPYRLSQFESFVPSKADLLIVGRPAQLLESEFGQSLLDMYSFADTRDFKNVELLMFASDQEVFTNAMNYRSRRAFQKIAAALQESTDGKEKQLELPTETIVNYLNRDFSGLVQFSKATDWKQIRSWLHSDADFKGKYFESEWESYKILECEQENTCVAIRLDERTYLVGNKANLTDAISNPQSENEQVSQWIAKAEATNFSGELFVGMDVEKLRRDIGRIFPAANIGPIDNILIALDLKKEKLLECDLGFPSPDAAQGFMSSSRKMVDGMITGYESAFKAAQDEENLWEWQAKRSLELLSSVEFNTDGAMGTIFVPRPKGFENWPKQYAKKMKAFERQQEEFKAVEMDPVLVANKAIKRGSLIQASDVKIENWPSQLVPEHALRSKDAVNNKKTNRKISKGMLISSQYLVGQSSL